MTQQHARADPVEQLAEQLHKALDRRLVETFKDPTRGDTASLPFLAEIIEKLEPQRWADDPAGMLIVVVRRAVKELPPEHPQTPRGDWHSSLTWREIGEILCGLRSDLPPPADGSPPNYDYYISLVKERSGYATTGLSERTFRRYVTHEFPLLLARSLLDLAKTPPPADTPQSSEASSSDQDDRPPVLNLPGPGAPAYVRRDALHAQFKQLVDAADTRLIALVGDRGNGKSRLALELAREELRPGQRLEYISAHTRESALRDIELVLNRADERGTDADASVGPASARFGRLLSSVNAPEYVIIDNLTDQTLLAEFVPPLLRSTVIVTCSSTTVLPPERACLLPIEQLAGDESRALIRQELSSASANDVVILESVLGGRPLAIVQACAFLADQSVLDVATFCRLVRQNAADIIRRTAVDEDATLTAIYELIIQSFENSPSQAYKDAALIIKMLVPLLPVQIPPDLLSEGFILARSYSDHDQGRAAFQAALRVLLAHYIAQPSAVAPDTLLAIHPLTQSIFKGLSQAEFPKLRNLIYTVMRDRFGKYNRTDPIDAADFPWTLQAIPVVSEMAALSTEDRFLFDVGRVCVTVIKALRQMGQPVEYLFDRIGHPLRWIGEYWMLETIFEWGSCQSAALKLSAKQRAELIEMIIIAVPRKEELPESYLSPLLFDSGVIIDRSLAALDAISWQAATKALVEQYMGSRGLGEARPQLDNAYGYCNGRICEHRGIFQGAIEHLTSALAPCRFIRDPRLALKRQLWTLKALVDVAIFSGEFQLSAYCSDKMLQLWDTRDEIRFGDCHTQAVVFHALLKSGTSALMSSMKDGGTGMIETANALLDRLEDVGMLYLEAGDRIGFYEYAYDLTPLYALTDPQRGLNLLGNVQADGRKRKCSNFLYRKLTFAYIRLGAMLDSFEEVIPDGLRDMAHTFRNEHGAPYWYCEALATAWFYSQKLGQPSDDLIPPLEEGYAQLGRPDRFAEIRLAASDDDKRALLFKY